MSIPYLLSRGVSPVNRPPTGVDSGHIILKLPAAAIQKALSHPREGEEKDPYKKTSTHN